ncbi:MAG: amidohydrolase family protein [Alphaproteobacteria bacterium]|nr:amidohydrolase family protein [Alphaproteobacteria bacterium]
MNLQVLNRKQQDGRTRLAIADCDIHPSPKSLEVEIYPYLSRRWQSHLSTYGMIYRQGFPTGPAFPKGQPDAARRDAYPPGGGRPGSDLDFMREQHLDPNNVQLGILNPLRSGQGLQNGDLAAAYCRAVNEWQVAEWTSREPRLKASVMVNYEDAVSSVAEIDRLAGNPNFAQVLLLSRTAEPLGQRRYWPIYEAACRAGLPVAVHAFGYGGSPVTGGGWPSYYIEEMVGHASNSQSLLASMVFEGVFERFPTLRLILVEAGFAWLPALAWRMDRAWNRMRDEVPHVTRPPSELVREHVWLTTQPMEEPEHRADLLDIFDWIGRDRLLFATDYPHWDYDDPAHALPVRLGAADREQFFLGNARRLYGLD